MKEESFLKPQVKLITHYIMEDLEETKIQQDDTQQELIDLYAKREAPMTVVALASPGTGKSTTISRIVQAMHSVPGQDHEVNFIVLTFTTKTRSDLLRKLKKLSLSYVLKAKMISRIKNFHALANDLLRWSGIINESKEANFTRRFINDRKLQASEVNLKKEIKRVRQQAMSRGYTIKEWDELLADIMSNPRCRIVGEYFKEYLKWIEKQYNNNDIITFDHAIVKATEFIQKGNQPLKKVSYDLDQLELVIVDEFQDCNPAQLRMIEALIKRGKKCKLLMVGDFDQNIFTWRGVDLAAINEFLKDRIDLKTKKDIKYLGNTYRLGQPLLDLSQKLICSNLQYKLFRDRFYKNYKLKARGKYNQQVQVRTFQREESEARWTIDQVCYYHFQKKIPLNQISILIRNMRNFNFTKLLVSEIKRRKLSIRYINRQYNQILKSSIITYLLQIIRYFQKRQGKSKDANSSNSDDQADVKNEIRNITEPIDRVGAKDQIRIEIIESNQIRVLHPDSFYTSQHMNYKAERIRNWNFFFADWEQITAIVKEIRTIGYLQCCKQILGVLKKVKWGDLDYDETKVEEFYELLEDVLNSLDSKVYSQNPLSIITNQLFSLTNINDKDEQIITGNHHVLMIQTIHSCKGLEYRVVFVSALNFQFPHWQKKNPFSILAATERLQFADDDPVQKLKEETRVIYTAITRSSQYCFVNSSKEFKKPHWLHHPKPHPMFQFIKDNAKFTEYVPYDPIKDKVVDSILQAPYELQQELKRLERQ